MLRRQERIQSNGMEYDLENYEIEGYPGSVDIVDAPKTLNGGFRQCRSMMPFDNLDRKLKDFRWDVYGGTPESRTAEKMANAFVSGYGRFRKEGKGYFIYSGTKGCGKTLLSCCLANEIMEKQDVSVKFISVLDYLELTKKDYKTMEEKADVERIRQAGILILDDIGVELKREWVNTALYSLINHRHSNRMVTLITSNSPLERLGIDDRVKDRINAMCIMLHLPEVPIRSIKARQENEKFLQSVIRNGECPLGGSRPGTS